MKMRKRLSTCLIVIGILLILTPFAGKAYTHYQQKQMYEAFLNMTEQQTSLMNQAFTEDIENSEAPTEKPPQVEGVMGRITIPSIKADLLLLEGSSSKELRYGAGHLAGTAEPGATGNCAIAGHRNYTFGTYFNRLDEVQDGDSITITCDDKTYTYLVYDQFTVLPTETSVLEQSADDSILTLITCAPKGSNTHRLIIRARLQI